MSCRRTPGLELAGHVGHVERESRGGIRHGAFGAEETGIDVEQHLGRLVGGAPHHDAVDGREVTGRGRVVARRRR